MQHIDTQFGKVAISQSAGQGPVILMIHGNSSSKDVFRNQLEGAIGARYRCIAMDLPGHGASEDANDPHAAYNMTGYAKAAIELMDSLGHDGYVVLGWSLGGHIGLEMLSHTDAIAGLMITGSPPVGHGNDAVSEGFLPSEHMHLAGQREFTEAEIDAYARATCGINAPFEEFLREAVARTDGQARELMLSKFIAGEGVNQQQAAMHAKVPLAIVNGGAEPFVNNDYVTSLAYSNLWEDKVHLIDEVGHAPFWEAPELFDPYIRRFVDSL